MKHVELCVRIDPYAPANAMSTIKIVKLLKNFLVLPNYIEGKMLKLKDNLEGFQHTLVPLVLKDDKNVREFDSQRNEATIKVNDMVKPIAQDMNMILFQESIVKLLNPWVFYEKLVKYNPYRQVVDQILEHKWPTNDEYEEQVKR